MFDLATIKYLEKKYPNGCIGGGNWDLSQRIGHNPEVIYNKKARELQEKNNKKEV